VRFGAAALLAGLSGFVALSHEILWFRVYAFLTWSRASTFGLLLGAYLAGLAGGAFLARRYCREQQAGAVRALGAFLLAGALAGLLVIPAVGELCRHAPGWTCLVLFGLVAALLGTGLPLIAHFGIAPADRVGRRLSWLYVANIAGSAAGSLLTGFVLLDLLPLGTVVVAVFWVAMAMAGLALWLARGPRLAVAGVVLLAAGGTAAAGPLFDGLYEKLTFKDEYHAGLRFRRVVENRSGVVSVDAEDVVRGGAVYDGRFSVDPVHDVNDIVRAYALFAVREAPRTVCVIGLGSGSWAQVLANHPAVERLTAIEINPGYLDVIRGSPVVASLLANPKVEVIVDDGRRWLHRTDRRFDAIVQNTTYHWRAHATNLLSREYLELCRRHLEPGGVVIYNTTHSRDAQRTGLELFPYAWLLERALYVSDAPLEPDFARWRALLLRYEIDGRRVIDPRRPDYEAGFAHLVDPARWIDRTALERLTREAVVITDDNMASEWH